MIRLAVELSLPKGSVAVERDGEIASCIEWNRPKKHAEFVYLEIERALNLAGIKKEEVEEVVVSSGPGSFTGVRLSVSVGKAFKVAGVRIFSSSTLNALSYGYEKLGFTPVPVIPARRGRVYSKLGRELLDLPLSELLKRLKEVEKPLIVYAGEVEIPNELLSFKEETPLSVKLLRLPRELLSPLTFHYVREHDAKPQSKGV
ncbi:tRNA (adenosine(37)-N6)-threonylcarbamoyltransferase complex dimerization subunit type 1 TsaB [Thermovibrio sp.]